MKTFAEFYGSVIRITQYFDLFRSLYFFYKWLFIKISDTGDGFVAAAGGSALYIESARIITKIIIRMHIRKTLLKISAVMLLWNLASVAYGANYEVQTDLLGRKQIFSEGKLIVTMKKNDAGNELFFNADREQIGSAVKNEAGRTDYFNAEGKPVGYAMSSADGTVSYFERDGRYIGNSSDTGLNNGLMFYDVVIRESNGIGDGRGDFRNYGNSEVSRFVKTYSL